MKNFNTKLKIFLLAAWVVSGFVVFSQSTINSYTSSASFQNLDNLQIYNAVRMGAAAAGGTATTAQTATLALMKKGIDTLNQSNRYAGFSTAFHLYDIGSKIYSTNNILGLMEVYERNLAPTKQGVDTLNQTQRVIKNRLNGTLSTSITALPTNSTNLATSANQTSMNTKLGNLYGNITAASLSHTLIESSTADGIETALDDWLADNLATIIYDIQLCTTTYWNGSAAVLRYSYKIIYR